MAAIGELFKTLAKNESFGKYCDELQNGKTNDEIVEMSFNDNNLMDILRGIIQDDAIIKNKMETIIGQKRKGLEKKMQQQTNKNNEKQETKKHEQVNNKNDDNDENNIEEEDDGYVFPYKPQFPERAIWLDKYCFLEQVDHRMRLVNKDMEVFY